MTFCSCQAGQPAKPVNLAASRILGKRKQIRIIQIYHPFCFQLTIPICQHTVEPTGNLSRPTRHPHYPFDPAHMRLSVLAPFHHYLLPPKHTSPSPLIDQGTAISATQRQNNAIVLSGLSGFPSQGIVYFKQNTSCNTGTSLFL